MSALDLIGAIEIAYERSSDEQTWLDAITRTVAPAFGGAEGAATSFVFDLTGDTLHIGTTSAIGKSASKREDYVRHNRAGQDYGPLRRAYECDIYTLLSRVYGPEAAKGAMQAAGIDGDDSLGLRANASPTSGIMLTRYLRGPHRVRDRELWTRFAAHLGAALRLRRLEAAPSPDSARAVLLPNGRLEDGDDETIAAKASLSSAAKAIDRARGKLRRLDPESATALWRTMVRGEWSLVDWYDHDGKRFLLAQENKIPSRSKKALTVREEQVVACAAMGHSNKLIAYDLGISIGSVSVLLGRAARKLGVSSRVALVRVFRETYVG